MNHIGSFRGGSPLLRRKMNRLVGGYQSLKPMFGGQLGGVISGSSGTTTQPSISQIRQLIGDHSRRQSFEGQITGAYPGIGSDETGFYTGKAAIMRQKPSTVGLLDTTFRFSTGSISFCNLNELTFSGDAGVNSPPALDLNGPLIVSGDLCTSDQNASGNGATKMIVGSFIDRPPPCPGVIVAAGPDGEANFSTTSTGPQQYWVQQAHDSSTDTTGQGTVNFSGISNAPVWAVTDVGSGGFRLPIGTPVNVGFAFNGADPGVLKGWVNTQQYSVFPCQLVSDGSGSLGTDSTTSSWKYYLKNPITGTYIGASSGSGQSPAVGRINGTFAAASWGLWYNNASNIPTLLVAFELPGTAHC